MNGTHAKPGTLLGHLTAVLHCVHVFFDSLTFEHTVGSCSTDFVSIAAELSVG